MNSVSLYSRCSTYAASSNGLLKPSAHIAQLIERSQTSSSCFDRFSWGFPANAVDKNLSPPPNSTGPGEFSGQNCDTKWNNDKRGSRQNDQGQANEDNTEDKA